MIRPPIPNSERYLLETSKPQQLLGIFEACMKTGPKGTEYGKLPDIWEILFSTIYSSPVELVDEMRSGKHSLGEDNEHRLNQFIKADCVSGGKFVLNVIKKGGKIETSTLIMIADLNDLARITREDTTAIHMLVNACDNRVRPELIKKLGKRLLSTLYDCNGIPVLFSIFGQSELCVEDLDAITQVFSNEELMNVMTKNRMGKNALELFTERSQSMDVKASRERNTFTVTPAVKDTDIKLVVKSQINPAIQSERVNTPHREIPANIKAESAKITLTNTPGLSGSLRSDSADNPGKLLKIMIVDDDQIIRHLLQLRLKILGYNLLFIAENGEDAVKRHREIKPDIIFMDIRMPGKIDGIDAAREIKKTHSDAQIIFLTAHNDPEIINRAKDINPAGYIHKPFTETDLRVILQLIT